MENMTLSIDAHLLEELLSQISSRSNSK